MSDSHSPRYRAVVSDLRQVFPQPVSDRVHDAYLVFSFLRALDQLDAMKSVSPILGEPVQLDYEAAKSRRVADNPQSLEDVTSELVAHLAGMFIWGHPRSQINVVPPPTIASVIGGLLPSLYNPNLVSEESAKRVAVAEVEVSAMVAELVGYDSATSAGLFTFGGSGTLLYGAKLGLQKCCPNEGRQGRSERAVLFCSQQAHYACLSVANWLGIGQDNVVQIPCGDDNQMHIDELETAIRREVAAGARIAAIVATMGTTDHFGLDDLHAVVELRDRLVDELSLDYVPHVHADAVIGWAWSVFNDYDFTVNPLEFRHRTVRALAGTHRRIQFLKLADSIGIDFHKTGFTPYISSMFLSRDAHDLDLIARGADETPYLFHDGHYHPGRYTLETSRSGGGPMAALANLLLFGKNGLRSLLGHLVSMAESLREHLDGHAATTVVNRENFGPVTLFRIYPDGVDTFDVLRRELHDPAYREKVLAHNDYIRRVFHLVHDDALRGEGVVLSMTDNYRETDSGVPLVALKSYILSPFSSEEYIDAVLESLWKARATIRAEDGN
ncbi:MAG: aspartate aminotransferase family protein [Planctomycetaceae bacterium]|nr:aspartate aminotransferase family protein [Planctomycetaceae bacterium]